VIDIGLGRCGVKFDKKLLEWVVLLLVRECVQNTEMVDQWFPPERS
jgi:hypothetical protein